MSVGARQIGDYRPVRWFLSGTIVHKLRRIIRGAFISNELDYRDWMAWPDDIVDWEKRDTGVWFDYLADTGDDSTTMKVMASCLSREYEHGGNKLPPGEFVFMGGDTAYAVADEVTIAERVVEPFNAAFAEHPGPPKRVLLGIPGNHDYYDDLVGFNRMFRKRPRHPAGGSRGREVLYLTDFERKQDASYVRVKLPGGWQLWGTDFWNEAVDYRQRAYFRPKRDKLLPDPAPGAEQVSPDAKPDLPPRNLILCTPTPPIAFATDMTKPPEKDSYDRLLGVDGAGFDVAASLKKGLENRSLLILSGDKHHYARYQSPEEVPSMMCVVSGGGGAFLHPTETKAGDLHTECEYPPPDDSRKYFGRRLATVIPSMYGAGLVWLVGAVLAWLFATTAPSTIFRQVPWSALKFWLTVIAGGVVLFAEHWTHRWLRNQRRRDYQRHGERYTQRGETASRHYQRMRHSPLGRWSAKWCIARSFGWAIRVGVVVGALILPYLMRCWWLHGCTVASIVFVGLAVLTVVALVLLAAVLGAPRRPRHGPVTRVGFGVLGACHGLMQVALPLIVVRYATVWLGAVAGLWLVFVPVGWLLYKRGTLQAYVLAVLWIGLGVAVPLFLPVTGPAHDWSSCRTLMYAAAAGIAITPALFSWYLLVAGSFDGHNNEIGTAIRSTRFKQWIRFHVTDKQLTGYVISIERPHDAALLEDPGSAAKVLETFALPTRPLSPEEATK